MNLIRLLKNMFEDFKCTLVDIQLQDAWPGSFTVLVLICLCKIDHTEAKQIHTVL